MGLLHVAKMPAANVVAALTSILILLWTINIVNAAREYTYIFFIYYILLFYVIFSYVQIMFIEST